MSAPESISDKDLTILIRAVAVQINRAGGEIAAIAAPLRKFVAPGVHVGKHEGEMTKRETLEWWAGQLLDVIDHEAWFAVNSWLNCCDKFAPLPGEVSP